MRTEINQLTSEELLRMQKMNCNDGKLWVDNKPKIIKSKQYPDGLLQVKQYLYEN